MYRLRLGLTALAVVLLGGLLLAQDNKSTDKDPPPRGSLPKYYKRLGLSDEQTQAVRKVTGEYKAKIVALKKKITDLQQEEREQLDKILTAEQRARLRDLKAGGPAPKDAKPPAKDGAPKKDK